MHPRRIQFMLSLLLALILAGTLEASRIKDLTQVEGARSNQLIGYGIVVGLAGDGDSQLSYTVQSVSNFLKRFGVVVDPGTIQGDNMAAVMITAEIGPFARPGSRIDVTVSSIGDADSINGGVLLQTPLVGADDVVYAVAQGPIAVGGFLEGVGGPGGATVQKNHPTVGTISSGAIVERRIPTSILQGDRISLTLLHPDFTTAARISRAINELFPGIARAEDGASVSVRLPNQFMGQETNFIAAIGSIEATPDTPAKVVINERTGTIVATNQVRVSRVAISHGAITITIASNLDAIQPNAFGEGETAILPDTDVNVIEVQGGFEIIEEYPSIERLTNALNALGVTTREMMSIFQTLKQAGALQAELVIQ
ncbi:MAG: flagellar basal body P-ring protein FlgI [Puniceicoccaceae bacterium]